MGVLGVTSIGALLASLTSGTLVIALPDILRELHTDLFTLMWIVVGYTLVSDRPRPQRRPDRRPGRAGAGLHAGFAIFTVASVACALAPTACCWSAPGSVQGVGGAFLMANSAALVTDAFPRRELGRALGINAMVVGAGLILGPILGGWLTSFGWRTVFWFNVPIGLIGTIAAATMLVEQAVLGRGRVRLGRLGPLSGRPSGLVTALAFGGIYGWTTPWVVGRDRRLRRRRAGLPVGRGATGAPLLDLGLFRNRLFALGNLTGLLNGIARNGVLFLLVFYLQGARATTRSRPGSCSRRSRSGCSSCRRSAAPSPTGSARAGLATAGDARHRDRPARADDDPGRHAVLAAGAVAADHRRRLGAVHLARTRARSWASSRRRSAASAPGRRMMLTQTGFVISIALSIGLVTSAMDPTVLLSIFSGSQIGSAASTSSRSSTALHLAFCAGVVASLLGAVVSATRGGKQDASRTSAVGRSRQVAGMTIRSRRGAELPSATATTGCSSPARPISLIGTWMSRSPRPGSSSS